MLPNDPIILLSVVNTKLRDCYSSLDALCDDLGESREEIESKLKAVGFEYDEASARRYCAKVQKEVLKNGIKRL